MNQTTTEQPMQNLETIKEEWGKVFGREYSEIDPEDDSIADWWLNKIKERDAMLWQKLEEKKVPENINAYSTVLTKKQIGHNQALSEAQSLLDVKEK